MTVVRDNLEEFEDPANYDLEEAESALQRIPYFLGVLDRIGGPVLELACGSGLITLAMARRCGDVTGVDFSRPMLEHASAKAAQLAVTVNWHFGDVRALDLGRRFRLIVLTGNAFQAFLTTDDQDLLLRSVHRHLASGGVFVFDTRNPGGQSLADEPDEQHWQDYRGVEGYAVRVSGTQDYDPMSRVMYWTTYRRWTTSSGARERVTRIACRFTESQELRERLCVNGFAIDWQHGCWDGRPLNATSKHIITGCRLRD